MKKLKSCTRSLYHIVPYRFCFLLIFCTNQVSVDNRGGKKSSPLTQKLLLKNKKKSFCIDTQWMTLIYDTSQTRVVCIWACIDKLRYTSCRILEIYTIWHEGLHLQNKCRMKNASKTNECSNCLIQTHK